MLTDAEQELRERFEAQRGTWTPAHGSAVKLDAAYFDAYLQLRGVAVTNKALEPRVQELVQLAVCASCTHLWQPGIMAHTAEALKAGASREEVMEVMELTSVLGVHALSMGVPLLGEVLREEGVEEKESSMELDDRRKKLKEDFQSKRGYFHGTWEQVLRLDPDFFEAYTRFSSVPFQKEKGLSKKEKELIYTAIDCATTHLYQPGLKTHIRNAVGAGATKEEILQVFELASLMGVHTVLEGAPILMRES